MADNEIIAAAAGPEGDEVRSDANVTYRPSSQPLEIQITSKVDYLYSAAIEGTLRRVASAMGVATGRLAVTDQGALEWVLMARVEACLRRAGFNGDPVLPQPSPEMATPPVRERLRRSRLYVPGNRPKLMLSAGLYGADGLILDLEDSVIPGAKDEARLLVRNALVALDWGSSERMVRVNQGELGERDLAAIAPHNPHVVLLPKVEEAEQVRRASALAGEAAGGGNAPFLMPILESPKGIRNAFGIAAAVDSVVALTVGLEDLAAELGARRTEAGWESFLARQTVVYAARAAGVQPIASVFTDIRDSEGLAAYVRRERDLGFDGVGCIHPAQIDVVHRELAPTDEQIRRAVAVVRAARDAELKGLGAVAVGTKMVDPPVVKQALRTVGQAVAAGVLAADWDSRDDLADR